MKTDKLRLFFYLSSLSCPPRCLCSYLFGIVRLYVCIHFHICVHMHASKESMNPSLYPKFFAFDNYLLNHKEGNLASICSRVTVNSSAPTCLKNHALESPPYHKCYYIQTHQSPRTQPEKQSLISFTLIYSATSTTRTSVPPFHPQHPIFPIPEYTS